MYKLTVNGVVICVYNSIDIGEEHYEWANKNYFVLIPGLPDVEKIWWRIQDEQGAYSLLKLAGHPNDVDLAVPQAWFEEQHKLTGEYPKACWSHENDAFGKPLYWTTIHQEAKEAVVKAILHR